MNHVDSEFVNLISPKLSKFKKVKADLYTFRCPLCGDSKKHKNKTRGYIFCHSKTRDLKAECLEADIIVAAVGIPELVKGDWVKKDTIVIDVGINKTANGIVGDVAFDEVSKNARALTPVPGGVGPMTIACLLKNTIDCFKRSQI